MRQLMLAVMSTVLVCAAVVAGAQSDPVPVESPSDEPSRATGQPVHVAAGMLFESLFQQVQQRVVFVGIDLGRHARFVVRQPRLGCGHLDRPLINVICTGDARQHQCTG